MELHELKVSEEVKARNPGVFGLTNKQIFQGDTWQDFEVGIIKYLQSNGWRVAHFRPAETKKGWRTACSGDKGFPDTLALKDGVQLILEAKAGTGKASPDQVDWMLAFQKAGAKVYLVTPENWEKVKQEIETV